MRKYSFFSPKYVARTEFPRRRAIFISYRNPECLFREMADFSLILAENGKFGDLEQAGAGIAPVPLEKINGSQCDKSNKTEPPPGLPSQ